MNDFSFSGKKLMLESASMNRILNPFWSVLFLAFIALLAVFAGLPENIAAYIICAFFLVIVILSPINGIYFLLLVTPFFLGNSKRPYYLMLEFFVYTTILSAIFHWFVKKVNTHSTASLQEVPKPLMGTTAPKLSFLNTPYACPVLLFLAVSLCSLPLNLKELLWEIWAWPPTNLLRLLVSSHEDFNIYYVRILLNLISAILLYFVIVSSTRSLRPRIKYGGSNLDDANFTEIFKPIAIIALITIIFGFLFLYNVIPHGGSYLSLSLVGRQQRAVTAFAYNRGYLGQYLIVTFPLIAFFLSGWRNHRALSLASIFVIIICISAVAFTFQRGPVIALISQALLFSVLYWHTSGRRRRSFFQCLGMIVGIVVILLITDHFFLGGRGLHRLLTAKFGGGRWHLWKVSWQMFLNNPLLGVGIGKCHYFVPEYAELANVPWRRTNFGRSTAHNVYLHILAEQGIIGLGCFIFLIGKIFTDIFKKLKLAYLRCEHVGVGLVPTHGRPQESPLHKKGNSHTFKVTTQKHRAVIIAVTVSLCGWLVFGFSQDMFYLRSMQIFFWVMLGFLSVILHDYIQPAKISKKTLIVTSTCLSLLFACRILTVTKYPFPANYSVGFYNWEAQPDGTKAHWMGKRAAMRIPVEGKELILKCRAAFPDLNLRPQKVYITTGEGYSKEVVLSNKDCVQIKIPSEKQAGKFIWVKFRTDYLITPAEEGWSKDTRRLGAMLYDVNWEE